MASVNVSVRNLNDVKSEIQGKIDKKIGAVRSNSEVYNELLWALNGTMVEYPDYPEDSGAMKSGTGPRFTQAKTWVDKKGREHKASQYPRYGNFYLHSRELVIDPVEERMNGDVHYAGHRKDTLLDLAEMASKDPEFIDKAKDIIIRGMNNG